MKYSLTSFATVVAVTVLLFAITPVNACEKPCRVGISNAFGDNYANETETLMQLFTTKLQENIYFGLPDVKSTTKSKCNQAVEKEVNKFEKKFSDGLEELIENSIFEQEPQFKGQCQHPLRVKQPPSGVAWTMEDCNNQDYICGNPPAICHFMDEYVKPRNVKNVIQSMTDRLTPDGSFCQSLSKAVVAAAQGTGVTGYDLGVFKTIVSNNILREFNTFTYYYAAEFCKGTTCDHYDHDIKIKLLSYP